VHDIHRFLGPNFREWKSGGLLLNVRTAPWSVEFAGRHQRRRVQSVSQTLAVPIFGASTTNISEREFPRTAFWEERPIRKKERAYSHSAESNLNRARRNKIDTKANDPACVKTHTSAKCRKHNSPTRHRTSRVQYVLTLRDAIDQRDFYVWRERWSFRTAKTLCGGHAAPPLLPVTFLVRADELCVGQHMAPHRSFHLGFCRAF